MTIVASLDRLTVSEDTGCGTSTLLAGLDRLGLLTASEVTGSTLVIIMSLLAADAVAFVCPELVVGGADEAGVAADEEEEEEGVREVVEGEAVITDTAVALLLLLVLRDRVPGAAALLLTTERFFG